MWSGWPITIGAERFFLAGHDWGAIAGWWTAQNFPERVRRFVALSAGHPAVWRARMDNDPEQRKKSRYVKMFRIPWLPEVDDAGAQFQGAGRCGLGDGEAGRGDGGGSGALSRSLAPARRADGGHQLVPRDPARRRWSRRAHIASGRRR